MKSAVPERVWSKAFDRAVYMAPCVWRRPSAVALEVCAVAGVHGARRAAFGKVGTGTGADEGRE